MIYSELEPKIVFSYFKKISDIPRGSGNEAAVAKFVHDTAVSFGHEAYIDRSNNVFVRAKSTSGYEDRPPIMLQGHLDMVCESNRDVKHNFMCDPISLVLDGDLLRAGGTTLGADDGVAVAIMLALLASDAPHPELECLFTTEEETGLSGMRNFNASIVKSKRLINIDSAGEGEATVSCAGGVRSHIFFDTEDRTPAYGYDSLSVFVSGLFGGHSGEDINLGRLGAISAMARILYSASKVCDVRISNIEGGSRDNAIPRECFVQLAVSDKDSFESAVRSEEEKIRSELISDDSGFTLKIDTDTADQFMTSERTEKLIALLRSLPTGVRAMSRVVPGLVETSSNLAVIRMNRDCFEIVVSSRSSVSSKLDDLMNIIECISGGFGAKCEHVGKYHGWDFVSGSEMQKLYMKTYREIFGKEAKIIGIHAGLECGLLKEKLPSMDMISIGPDIKNLHSPDEVLSVSSLSRLWTLICEMLKNA